MQTWMVSLTCLFVEISSETSYDRESNFIICPSITSYPHLFPFIYMIWEPYYHNSSHLFIWQENQIWLYAHPLHPIHNSSYRFIDEIKPRCSTYSYCISCTLLYMDIVCFGFCFDALHYAISKCRIIYLRIFVVFVVLLHYRESG